MMFTVQLVVGLLVGWAVLAFSRRRAPRGGTAAWAWAALASGAAAVTVLGVALTPLGARDLGFFYPSIALPAAAAVFCAGRVVAGDRRWQSWAGLVLAAAPMAFWVFFVVAEILGPAH